jgi:protein-S-isoprenylcysteine O-methyltransferase Ste14
LAAVWVFAVALVASARPTLAAVLAGLPFLVAGEAVRAWSAGHLLKTRQLILSGPYRFVRNPLYLGRLLILVGLCLMARLPYHANLVVLVLGCAVFFGYYLPRKERVEPARLRAAHGERYEAYHRAVPSLLPRLTPYGEDRRRWDRSRFLRNREHWMVLAMALIAAALTLRALRA